MLSIDIAEAKPTAGPGPKPGQIPKEHEAMSIILSAILITCYAGLLAIVLILAAGVDNDDQE